MKLPQIVVIGEKIATKVILNKPIFGLGPIWRLVRKTWRKSHRPSPD